MPPELRVEVQEIRTNGIVVLLPDRQQRGLIRWRELSWDRSFHALPTIPKPGEQLTVVPIQGRSSAPLVALSVRRCTDPWVDLAHHYRIGQIVQGEVVNIRNFGVFVQLTPGIDAVIWPRDLPLGPNELSATVIAVGDIVQGVITQIDEAARRIEVSLNLRLAHLSNLSLLERYTVQHAALLQPSTRATVSSTTASGNAPVVTTNSHGRYYPPLPLPDKVLVIDDSAADAQLVQQHLAQAFGFMVDYVQSGQEALERLLHDEQYTLCIIDLWLRHEQGTQVAQELLALYPTLTILFATSDPTVGPTITLGRHQFLCMLKKPAELIEGVDQLLNGYWSQVQQKEAAAYIGDHRFIQQLGMTAFERRPGAEILYQLLHKLQQETRVSQVLLLDVDAINKVVTIASACPPLAEAVALHSLDGLYYSPVRTVVEVQDEFYHSHIDQTRSAQFKNFFPLLVYQVCYGLPITIPDHLTRHALFLLDEHRQTFDERILTQAQLTAYLLQVALERTLLLEFMRRFELRYTHGLLLGTLVHELLAKLDGLAGQTQRLTRLVEPPGGRVPPPAEALQKIRPVAQELVNAKAEMEELLLAYSRMAQGRLEAVDVNQVAQKVIRQLTVKAREAQVTLQLEHGAALPLAHTISSRLEQVLTNLVLNGIQQIERQAQRMKYLAERQHSFPRLLQSGVVWVKTTYIADNPVYPIQLLVIDTGPGIHRHQQEDIFLLDTSNRRRGHGLGLFISRNLIETMGGRLQLLHSILFFGSAFLVELPAADLTA